MKREALYKPAFGLLLLVLLSAAVGCVSHDRPEEILLPLSVAAVILLAMLVLVFFLLIRSTKTKNFYKNKMLVLSALYKSLPDIVYSKDANGVYTSVNQAFEDFMGVTETEVIGKTLADIYLHDQELAGRIMESDRKIISEATGVTSERLLTLRDQSKRFYEATCIPLIQDGTVTGLLGISRDISEHKALIAEIEKNNKLTRLMLDTIPLCCFLIDQNNKCIFCNNETVRLFMLEDKQAFIDRFFDLSPKYQENGQLSSEESLENIRKAFEEGGRTFYWMHQLLDGTPLPALVTLVRVSFDNNYVFLAYIRDMRQHNQMLMEIGHQEYLLHSVNSVSATLLDVSFENLEASILQSMNILARAVDVDRVHIWKNYTKDDQLHCAQLYEWPGTAEPQYSNKYTLDASYDEDLAGWEESLTQGNSINTAVRNMPQTVREPFLLQGILSILVIPVFLADNFWGFIRFDDFRKERIFAENEKGLLFSASRMIANTLFRDEANQQKAMALDTLEGILNGIDAVIYVSLPETGEILFINNNMKRLFNLDDSCIGKLCYQVLQKDMTERCNFCACNKLDKDPNQIVVWEDYNTILNRSFRNVGRYITWADGSIVHLNFSIDITELIATRELAKQSNKAKSSFLAKMSHEIRTPMNAIIGMAELALRQDMSTAAREHIFTAKQAGINLLAIINDILDFSKVEAGKIEIAPSEYLFSSLINDVISIIRMRLMDSQIRFVVNLDSNVPNALFGDEIRIRQILLNLLDNAVKYTDKGFISFSVKGELIDEDTVSLTMEIKDSGRGIKQVDIVNLFIEYVQFDEEKNEGITGTGIGLSIAKALANIMGGDITVQSEYEAGSIFTVTLLQKIHSSEPLAFVTNSDEKNVILYERRKIYADSVAYSFENLGISCTLVSSDSEFEEKIRDQEFSFIFISISKYNKNKNTISNFGATSKIVLITEFGGEVSDKSLNCLTMPIHTISIANILNNMSDSSLACKENNELVTAGFIAPDARILVVDDINTNLKVTAGLLLPYKTQVDLRKNGLDAITALKNAHYDLVFMDHKMPKMDGIETTLHIRKMGEEDPYFKNVPIIALTANAILGIKEMFTANGFNDFLSKPMDTVKLNAILEKWIPREKQISVTIEENSEAAEKLIIDSGIEIIGLDVKNGITLSGGTIESYLATLGVFCRDGLARAGEVLDCLENGNLSLYTIHVHALKSASANIGADALSETANTLESAGVRNDLDFIKTHTDSFLAELNSLMDEINIVLSARRKSREGNDADLNTETLKVDLVNLRMAIDEFDAETTNKAIGRLLALTHEHAIGNIIETISDNLLIAEYDKAIESINTLLMEETSDAF